MSRHRLFALIAMLFLVLPLLAMDKHVVADDFDIPDTSDYSLSAQDDISDPELIVPASIVVAPQNARSGSLRTTHYSHYRNPDHATPLRPPCA